MQMDIMTGPGHIDNTKHTKKTKYTLVKRSEGNMNIKTDLMGGLREFAAETLGTCVLLMFGCGSVAQAVLSNKANGDMFSINVGWGLGVLIGVLVSGPVSGGHLNPAVSVALACVGKFKPSKLPHYIAGQYLGAFLGAAVVFMTYREAIDQYSDSGPYQTDGDKATAGIFVTFPAPGISNMGGFIDQVVGTALLLLAVMAINFRGNSAVSRSLGPLLVALTVVAVGVCFGHNAGYAINPARDLGPRLLISIAGWGTAAFTSHDHWWWIPVVACHLGAVLGSLIYFLLIEKSWKEEKKEKLDEENVSNLA